jgi:hypothetical protein
VTAVSGHDGARLAAVVVFADNVLRHDRDRYGPDPTPLFADGVDAETLEPARWTYVDRRAWVLSKLAEGLSLPPSR